MCLKFLLLSMRSKSIRIFISKSFQHNHWNELIENINTNISKYHANVNVISIEKKFQINGRITRNVDVSVKNIANVKKVIFGILVLLFLKMENI